METETSAKILSQLDDSDPAFAAMNRGMAERVFRQLTGASAGHAHCLNNRELATYLASKDWTWADVVKRES